MASASRFCVFWIRNTIRKVTIVVPVFITSCHVSLNPNKGPVINQARITTTAIIKVTGLPLTLAVHFAKRVNHDLDFGGFITENYSAARIPKYFRNQSAARLELTSNPAKE